MQSFPLTVNALRVAALAAAEWRRSHGPVLLRRAAEWDRRRLAYVAARRVMCGQDGARAEALARGAAHRALAWAALANGDAQAAAHHRRQAHKARAMCEALTPEVWKR
jgi:hypothetical protein